MVIETVTEASTSVLKGAIGAIPFVGTALNEVIFECRGRIKQNRINNFVLQLGEYIEDHSENIDVDYIKSEQFGDILESIFTNVLRTGVQDKIARFKKILVNQMNPSNYNEFTDTFLDIVSKINEKEIQILDYYSKNDDEYGIIKHERFNINENIYKFYIQDLISKCLIIDDSVGRAGAEPLSVIRITHLGRDFLSFIKEN